MTEYQPGQPAVVVHSALKSAANTMEKAKQNAILWFGEIVERKLYKDFGYSSIHMYAEKELGFGKSKTYDFLNICRRLKELPKIQDKVKSGELGYTDTLEILKVTDKKNQDQWLELARKSSRRQLAKEVKLAKKEAADNQAGQPSLIPVPRQRPTAAVPVRVSIEFSPTQFARYEALWENLRKRGGMPVNKADALLEMMASYEDRFSSRLENETSVAKPPAQVFIHQCPDCQKATTQTSKGELEIGQAELDQALCDCQISRPGQRNSSSIAPKVRRKVLTRARYKCQRPGCGHTRHLEVHHIVPRSQGGTNEESNLVCLCSGCHRLVHQKPEYSSSFQVKSPGESYLGQFFRDDFQTCPPVGQHQLTPMAAIAYDGEIFDHLPRPAFPQGRFVGYQPDSGSGLAAKGDGLPSRKASRAWRNS